MIDPLKFIDSTVVEVNDALGRTSKPVLKRYPVLFGVLTSFGAMFVLYGFERMADSIPLLSNNPDAMFVIGVVLLLITGTLYKSLGHKK